MSSLYSVSGHSELVRTDCTGGYVRSLYQSVLENPADVENQSESREFLKQQLQRAAHLDDDMPSAPAALFGWMETRAQKVGEQYADYLEQRKAGHPRRFFSCRSHALWFLQQVAPTKLVDGAWLYGVLQHWQDSRYHPLLRTYLEELGDGDPAQNHVVLYRKLLATTGCDPLPDLADERYVQGAVQLALGYHAEEFLPELIGYNLGYEQLPLHLLISAFELNELDIDPYYFTLHVTIDNGSTGHARKAVQAVIDSMPVAGDSEVFLERVNNGYKLNDLGVGSAALIEAFDLDQELIDMLERKRVFGQHMHSDYCRIEGRTVNQWLAEPGLAGPFLEALQKRGWIKRGEDPRNSRFWNLIDGQDALMFGVFSPFERQLLHDWIADGWFGEPSRASSSGSARPAAFRPSRRKRGAAFRTDPVGEPDARGGTGADPDVAQLQTELSMLSPDERARRLIELMSPGTHATAAGLYATRLFVDLMDRG
ncbi:Iron-containing redox enzyme [Halopseudomonas xinjiangensis]|uniref:Iron-containing redox enzyme n=1 Tax=Halopseudomonas xinjiangensis TaxID=487184 RepID=A0A1H1W8D4_9GAMM|nr:iron-containing redox enzyme family protein [Halopseudomonas xinjiangensis]SDS92940.1 Iron-containing redox enzyme [Halopseudomonas xinjiangensis]